LIHFHNIEGIESDLYDVMKDALRSCMQRGKSNTDINRLIGAETILDYQGLTKYFDTSMFLRANKFMDQEEFLAHINIMQPKIVIVPQDSDRYLGRMDLLEESLHRLNFHFTNQDLFREFNSLPVKNFIFCSYRESMADESPYAYFEEDLLKLHELLSVDSRYFLYKIFLDRIDLFADGRKVQSFFYK
jgi:hypothetical protein